MLSNMQVLVLLAVTKDIVLKYFSSADLARVKAKNLSAG